MPNCVTARNRTLRIVGRILTAVVSLACGGSVTSGNVDGGVSSGSGGAGVGGEGGRPVTTGVGGGAGTTGVGGNAWTNDAGGPRTPCQELLALDPSGLYYASCRPKDLPVPI